MADLLFPVRNNFYLGAYQAAISEASQLTGLNDQQKLEREIFTQRSYLEIGSHDVSCNVKIQHRRCAVLLNLPVGP